MSSLKLGDGKPRFWLAEVSFQGREGPRKRKHFATKGEKLVGEIFLILME